MEEELRDTVSVLLPSIDLVLCRGGKGQLRWNDVERKEGEKTNIARKRDSLLETAVRVRRPAYIVTGSEHPQSAIEILGNVRFGPNLPTSILFLSDFLKRRPPNECVVTDEAAMQPREMSTSRRVQERRRKQSDSPYIAIRSDPRNTGIDETSEESDTILEEVVGDKHLETDSMRVSAYEKSEEIRNE